MKKRMLWVSIMIIIFISPIFAAEVANYFDVSYFFTFDSNITSIPLVQNAGSSWLEYRSTTPFERKLSNGFSITNSTFFSKKGRTGLSVAVDWGKPFSSVSYKPEGDFSSNWDYVEYNSLKEQKDRLFFSFGPAFRCRLGIIDFGIDARLSIGTYNYFIEAVVMGFQAGLNMSLFFDNNWYFKYGVVYDGHFIRLYINDPKKIYDDHYMMYTLGARAGLGYCFGGRGE